LPPTAIG
jgi:hypothetical protein